MGGTMKKPWREDVALGMALGPKLSTYSLPCSGPAEGLDM